MKRCFWFLALLCAVDITTFVSAKVIGYVDGTRKTSETTHDIVGWSCQRGQSSSVSVHAYLQGPDGKLNFFKSVLANKASESAVQKVCNSKGTRHRYRIPMSGIEVERYKNFKIHVFGISPTRSGNPKLRQSGKFKVPVPTTRVTGIVDFAPKTYMAGATIYGWACQTGDSSSIGVHLYARHPSTRKLTFIKGAIANLGNEPGVSSACKSLGKRHRYKIPIRAKEARLYQGQQFVIYGISTKKTGNLRLFGNERFLFPKLPRTKAPIPSPKPSPSRIVGHIDAAANSVYRPNLTLNGWACQQRHDEPVMVHMYIKNSGGKMQYIKAAPSDKPAEQGVSKACGSSGGRHRFRIPITAKEVRKYQGLPIYIFGISPVGTQNLMIRRSGDVFFPKAPTTKIVGNLDTSVSPTYTPGMVLRGWACQQTIDEPISVHMYVKTASGKMQFVKPASANRPSEPAVATACDARGSKYRFEIPITEDEAKKHGGLPIFVYGLSPVGTPNLAVGKSGHVKFPVVPTPLSRFMRTAGQGDITIPPNVHVVIDKSAALGLVKVQGKLLCPETGNFQLQVDGIGVTGESSIFECGTKYSRFRGKLDLVFRGNRDLSQVLGGSKCGAKALVATNSGVISLHGKAGKGGFQKLRETAPAGSNRIRVDAGSGWSVGDSIVISSSGFDPLEAEERTVAAISPDRMYVTLDQELDHFHFGKLQHYGNERGTTWTLDERSEVINLSRNIRIMSADDGLIGQSAPLGAHTMIKGAGSAAYIDSVEFYRVGQAGIMGRYPFHWHKKGNVSGQYIRDSSIHESYSRCITIHQSSHATVQRNACYNHFGHGYFLEDGNEIKNRLIGNIGLLSRIPKESNAMLESDIRSQSRDRFAPTSTFWISHPDNYIKGNVAAGSEGSGFWMAFVPTTFGTNPIAHPQRSNTLAFDDNVAHSCVVGVTHDGAPLGAKTGNPLNAEDRKIQIVHYSPPTTPTLNNLVVYKNSETGIYFRGNRLIYKGTVLADNGVSGFFAYDQELVDSIIIGKSQNMQQTDLQYQARRRPRFLEGLRVYDGPWYLQNVHFAGFPSQPLRWSNVDLTPTAFTQIGAAELWLNQAITGITIEGQPLRKIALIPLPGNFADALNGAIYDREGAIVAGSPGALIRPDHPFVDDPVCRKGNPALGEHKIILCRYDISYLRIQDITRGLHSVQRTVARVKTSDASRITIGFMNKLSMILDKDYEYEFTDLHYQPGQDYMLKYFSQGLGNSSPVLWFPGAGSSCHVKNRHTGAVAPRLGSLGLLRDHRGFAMVSVSGGMYAKLEGQRVNQRKRPDTFRGETLFTLQC